MTINSTYTQSFALPGTETPAPAPVSTTPSAAPVDRVKLSPEATAQAAASAGSSTPQRGDALFNALDANKDGSVTEQEFADGATALLRRAGAHHHHRHVHGDNDEGHGDQGIKRSGRLERKLEKLFDSVDANHDGSIDTDELAKALAQVKDGPPDENAPVVPAESQAPVAASVTRVTYVAVAVQQYTAIGELR